jgi:antitoxin component of MazEF toxin-antitoxin module
MPLAKIRKSGNSTVLVLSPEVVKERKLRIGDTVGYQIFKNIDLKKLFGRGKHLKIDAQKAKDELREEWQFI